MRACIYARTSTKENRHNVTSIKAQIEYCHELAKRHNLTIEKQHIFTDIEMGGGAVPTCWAKDDEEARPALSEAISAIEDGEVSKIIIRSLETLGTTSEILSSLLNFLSYHDASIIVSREQLEKNQEPRAVFALSILAPRLQVETESEREERSKLRAKKVAEIGKLQSKITRLEAEVADLSDRPASETRPDQP